MRFAEPRPHGRGYALTALQAWPSIGTELRRAEGPTVNSDARQKL
jgi:hypothetical protein